MFRTALALLLIGLGIPSSLRAQARGGEWTTSGGDAQRTAWVRADARLTKEAVQEGQFRFLWKAGFDNDSRQLNALTEPILEDRLIGYRGFKALAFVGGSADRLFAIDSDLARPYWTTHLTYAAATGGQPPSSWECPGGLIATPSRRTTLAPSAFGGGGSGGGEHAVSAVGEPGRGAAVLSEQRPSSAASAERPAASRDVAAPAARPRSVIAPIPFGGVDPLYVMGSDGLLRTLRVSDGAPMTPPVPFLPPNARPSSLTFIDGVIYTTTSHGCGAAPNGVWALDLTAENKVSRWDSGAAYVAGAAGPAFGTDGTVYVATSRDHGPGRRAPAGGSAAAAGTYADSVIALDASTLEPKDWLETDAADFNATPVVFTYKDRALVAVSGNDGRLYLLDATSLGGADHRTPLHVTAKYTSASTGGGLATWEDEGRRWIVATVEGKPTADPAFASNGLAPVGGLVAFTLEDSGGQLTLAPAWRSRSLVSPLAPLVVNGMVLAVSSGEYRKGGATLTAAQRKRLSVPGVLYVLDGSTGKQLWTSGQTITSFARASMAAGSGQVYLVTYDNHLYAFGIPMEH
jgi:outer membrane protein assembly factor BamB